MTTMTSLKCTLNREYLPANQKAVIFLAMEVLPPADAVLKLTPLPSAICLLIDRSGSMEGDKLDQAKIAANQVIDKLQPTDYVGVVTFGRKIDKVADLQQVQSMDIATCKRKIQDMQAEGTTELYKGLDTALQQILRAGKDVGNVVKRVILLSDGQPTDNVPDEEYTRLSRRMRELGISVQTVGIGPDYNEDLLGSIAEYSGGIWKHISSASEILHL